MRRWRYSKYEGCGNDFILFDNRENFFPIQDRSLIARLCNRQEGIGADGILLLEASSIADCRMRILNSDGSEAEMCGNGLRCFVKWLANLGFIKNPLAIEVNDSLYKAFIDHSFVRIEMNAPTDIQWKIPVVFEEHTFEVDHINTGVPHTLLFVDAIETIDLIKIGRFLRFHPLWVPKGTNVTVIQEIEPSHYRIRTYERGVEGETLACGTGAVAAALAATRQGVVRGPVTMHTQSGERLFVDFIVKENCFSNVALTGPAKCMHEGEIELPEHDSLMV